MVAGVLLASQRGEDEANTAGFANQSDNDDSMDQAKQGSPRTTLMIKNVPRGYSEQMLLHNLRAVVGTDGVDFFFMPWDKKRNGNSGFAFVNFVDPSLAQKCLSGLSGQSFRGADGLTNGTKVQVVLLGSMRLVLACAGMGLLDVTTACTSVPLLLFLPFHPVVKCLR